MAPRLVVTAVAEHPPPAALKRLEREYALRAKLDRGWAARPRALTHCNNRPTLVLEGPGREPLDRLLSHPVDTARFPRFGVSVAAAVRHVHQRNLIFKDIKPALGVTLYGMIAGVLPFTAADAMAWIHCDIARQPVPRSERVPTVSTQISSMVMKLLAKTAEDRHQTAACVLADLQRCLTDWERQRRIDPFPLGAHDNASDRLMIREYGRKAKIGALCFNQVIASGMSELVLVSRYSGIGKSSLVNEPHKTLVPPRGLFAAGKFDRYKRTILSATLARAFQSLVHRIVGMSDAEMSQWRAALLEARPEWAHN